MPLLGVNIDHVATVRQARLTNEPDPVHAAVLAEMGGADGITVHLREDRRHIQDRDVRLLRETIRIKLNLEMAVEQDIVDFALKVLPDQATLVPEKREELTTEGGLDVVGQRDRVRDCVAQLQGKGIEVSGCGGAEGTSEGVSCSGERDNHRNEQTRLADRNPAQPWEPTSTEGTFRQTGEQEVESVQVRDCGDPVPTLATLLVHTPGASGGERGEGQPMPPV